MSKRILVVDDSAFMRNMLKDILKQDGCEIIGEADNGADAIEKYKQLKPDLITIDMIMPKMNGIEAVKEILKIDTNAKLLMVSAMGQQPLVDEALSAGAKNFIIKPFQAEKVLETVREIFKD